MSSSDDENQNESRNTILPPPLQIKDKKAKQIKSTLFDSSDSSKESDKPKSPPKKQNILRKVENRLFGSSSSDEETKPINNKQSAKAIEKQNQNGTLRPKVSLLSDDDDRKKKTGKSLALAFSSDSSLSDDYKKKEVPKKQSKIPEKKQPIRKDAFDSSSDDLISAKKQSKTPEKKQPIHKDAFDSSSDDLIKSKKEDKPLERRKTELQKKIIKMNIFDTSSSSAAEEEMPKTEPTKKKQSPEKKQKKVSPQRSFVRPKQIQQKPASSRLKTNAIFSKKKRESDEEDEKPIYRKPKWNFPVEMFQVHNRKVICDLDEKYSISTVLENLRLSKK